MVRFAVDGADVEITKIVLNWDNRRDDTITSIGLSRREDSRLRRTLRDAGASPR